MKIILVHNKGFHWIRKGNSFAAGVFFDRNGVFCDGENLLSCFNTINDPGTFRNFIEGINGILTVILQKKNYTYIFCDKSRYIPLYYSVIKNNLIISDEPGELLKLSEEPKLNSIARASFLGSGYVIGNMTLVESIKQVQAGEYIVFSNDAICESGIVFSFRTRNENFENTGYAELWKLSTRKIDNAFNRLIRSLQGRTAVIPLSGGYDSRLIAACLRKNGYKKAICFTYGKRENPETEISERTAKNLGYPWYFIEYTPELIHDYICSEEFNQYYTYASRMVSMFYMQEYFATQYLKSNHIVPDDSVFLPGHSGDLLGGSQLVKIIPETQAYSSIAAEIFSSKFILNKISEEERNQLIKFIDNQVKAKDNSGHEYGNHAPYSIYEDWDIKEKIAKFNINSSHVFGYFGYEVRFPFWDNELVDFYRDIPFKYRAYKRLFNDILREAYFKPMGVHYKRERNPTVFQIRKQVLKNRLKKFIPEKLINRFNYDTDYFNYKDITAYMVEQAINKGENINTNVRYYNAIIAQWYLLQLEHMINAQTNKK